MRDIQATPDSPSVQLLTPIPPRVAVLRLTTSTGRTIHSGADGMGGTTRITLDKYGWYSHDAEVGLDEPHVCVARVLDATGSRTTELIPLRCIESLLWDADL